MLTIVLSQNKFDIKYSTEYEENFGIYYPKGSDCSFDYIIYLSFFSSE